MSRVDYETIRYAITLAAMEGGITYADEASAIAALDRAVRLEELYETENER